MTTTQVFGNFNDALSPSQEFLLISFSPSSISLKQRWRNNGLSADFIADYLTTFFPKNEDTTTTSNKQAEIKSAVSYIANELLENAMKFNDEASQQPISIALHLYSDHVVFLVTNSIPPQGVKKFQAFIEELTSSDLEELYIRQLEKNATDEYEESGLGLLTMMNDYLAKIGWKFATVTGEPEVITVTTMLQLTV
ncbi:MAG: ATP-binding protein [Gloeocapsa sp. UFS-A4-WI-NPMV-4B04]|nr:ATP-binding protein [Gloeocapsa sp. UFS-A4-WI-NPMV-4B04]